MSIVDEGAIVLVADADVEAGRLLTRWLRAARYAAVQVSTMQEAMHQLHGPAPRLVLLDLEFDQGRGGELQAVIEDHGQVRLAHLVRETTPARVLMEAVHGRGHLHLFRPLQRAEVLGLVARVIEAADAPAAPGSPTPPAGKAGHGMIGESQAISRTRQKIDRAASSEVTVLVGGETGTGKELVARAIHRASARASGPFVAVNCGAIPRELQESELFGHEKGAFTGALGRHVGRFEQAHRGVIFLDEVAELTSSLQAALLRVLQERRFYRVGGTEEVSVDVRVVAATHRDLHEEAIAGRFRQDLLYRLAVYELELPPLRQRTADILPLARHFLRSLGGPASTLRLSSEVEAALLEYPWPGNVRELQNAMHAVSVTAVEVARLEDLPERIVRGQASSVSKETMPPTLAGRSGRERLSSQAEKDTLVEALARTHGNVSRAMAILGLPRTTMYRRLRRHGLMGATSDGLPPLRTLPSGLAAPEPPAPAPVALDLAWPPGSPRLLIVEDDPLLSGALVRIAQHLGLCARTVPTAEGALEIIDRAAPDGVLLDINLGGTLDGRDVMARLSESGLGFWVCSGQADEYTVQLCEEYGARSFWPKPIQLRPVIERIQVELNQKVASQQYLDQDVSVS